jgi:hypothetical protein
MFEPAEPKSLIPLKPLDFRCADPRGAFFMAAARKPAIL